MVFFKIVEFVGEVLIFAINHDFQCTNATIKILLCSFRTFAFSYSVMLCIMYLDDFVRVIFSTVNHK